ncbi:MAG: MC/SLC25 family protein [Bdellovibrionales bacterium]|nr:MC/SLC25 family protein [Bdellovibrionales bacterium]
MAKAEEQSGHSSKSLSSFLSGGVAGVVAKTCIAPIERVKFLFIVLLSLPRQTSNRKFTYHHFFSDYVTIVKKHGMKNLWRGNTVNVARVFPNAAIVSPPSSRTSQSLTT